MPTTDTDSHSRARRLFGSIDAGDVEAFLTRKGWKLQRDWSWRKPFNSYKEDDDELFAVWFLIFEWDYDGIDYGPYYAGHCRFIDPDGVPCRLPRWTYSLSDQAQRNLHLGIDFPGWVK